MLNSPETLARQADYSGPAPFDSELASPGASTRFRAKFLAKRIMDCAVAAAALVLLLPLFLLCAMVINCVSPGPVFFAQKRVGFRGREFTIYKFRTMRPPPPYGADRQSDAPRIFWFGRLLRHVSIDELPQLINVLRGEMSLVGPRPHMVGQLVDGVLFEDAVFQYARRYHVMPGMTGWAQINGCRGPAVTHAQIARRVAFDLAYIDGWSLSFDVLIIIRTLCFGFIGANTLS